MHTEKLRVVSLFSGIGGIELGLHEAGHQTVLFCESERAAQCVLETRFPEVELATDITRLDSLPDCDLVTAGWPCQDISLAGGLAGLSGTRSGLIREVFRLLRSSGKRKPSYILLENVPFAIDLSRGEVLRHVLSELEAIGYNWAYRILNTQYFGLPQRRRRLFILASLDADPAAILLDGIRETKVLTWVDPSMVGFYWTEGNRGVGWTPEAVPPLKGGSGVSIPSPPGIWDRRTGAFVTPSLTDAERLQGFCAGWTSAADKLEKGSRRRWTLIGNAVSVPVTRWIGQRLATRLPDMETAEFSRQQDRSKSVTPRAAFGGPNTPWTAVDASQEGPTSAEVISLREFGLVEAKALSRRAAAGFTKRYSAAPLRKDPHFLDALVRYIEQIDAAL